MTAIAGLLPDSLIPAKKLSYSCQNPADYLKVILSQCLRRQKKNVRFTRN
jgi:hypothetical protein